MSPKSKPSLSGRLRDVLASGVLGGLVGRLAGAPALSGDEQLALRTLDSIGDAVIAIDLDNRITYVNDVAEALVGWPRAEAIGRPVAEILRLVDSLTHESIANPLMAAMAENRPVDLAPNAVVIRRDGGETAIEDCASPIVGNDGEVVGGVIVLHDVTAARTLALKLSYGAWYDSLTDLPNRMLLDDRLAQAIARAVRSRQKLALLFLDLDRFKQINDTLGHATGDALLKQVAQRLIACVRGSDTVCRRSGDEFVVLLSEVAHSRDAGTTAEKILQALAEPYLIDGQPLSVTASVGVGIYPDDGADPETLMRHADLAMYAAKNEGRNGFRFFKPEMNLRAVERQAIEQGLRLALERDEFTLVYQPRIQLSTGAIIGVEALLRWVHPELGVLAPARFLRVAEDSGLIVAIDRWVLRQACGQMRAWQDAGLLPLRIAVNLSAGDLRAPGFVSDVQAILEQSGLPPGLLELELKEDFLLGDAVSATAITQQLKTLGVQLALGDFGKGHSSLGHLKPFGIDALKIDQSFIHAIATNADDAGIVNAVIGMGASLKLRVVAEGVETAEQTAILREEGCLEGQGHYFSKPVGLGPFTRMLQRGARPELAEALRPAGAARKRGRGRGRAPKPATPAADR